MTVEMQDRVRPAGDERAAVRSPAVSPRRRLAAVGGVCVVAGAALGVVAATRWQHPRTDIVVTTAAPFTYSGSSGRSALAGLVAAVQPSVVSITVSSPSEIDIGTGVVVTSDGMILTANHVIAHAGRLTVRLADGRTDAARVVARAPGSDLGVIRTATLRALPPATFGSAKHLQTGDEVLVIGNPLGLAGTVTRGIVSALHRSVPVNASPTDPHIDPLFGFPDPVKPTAFIRDAIQTDAVVQPGNSGGPLLDLHGHVIGILCTVVGDEPGSTPDTGLAFAIPSDTAWPTALRLIAHG